MKTKHLGFQLGTLCCLLAINSALALPDLVVQDIWTVPAAPVAGQSFVVHALVSNQGDADAGSFFSGFDVGFFLDNVPVGSSRFFFGLAAHQTAETEFQVNTAPAPGSHPIRVCADPNNEITESNEANNCRTENSVVTSTVPDLIIQDVWSTPDPLVLGQSYTFYARVVNQGDATASAGSLFSQRVDFYVDGSKIGQASYDDVSPGGNVVVSINATANASPFVTHQFRAEADADNRIDEGANEGNNTRTENWSVTAPDLVVVDIWTSPATPTNGQICTLYASIKNQGNAPAGTCSAGVYRDGSFVYQTFVPPLGTNQTTTISWNTTFAASGAFLIRVKADINDQVPESNEGNNERTEPIIVMPGPVLRVSPSALTFGYSPTEQTFSLWNGGGGVLGYSVDANRPWLGVFPGGGTCAPGETNVTSVSIDVSGLLIGTNTGTITVSSSVGTSSIAVTVIIADDDHDQIPDGWETQYFGSAANCNPFLDPDGDGQNNRQEWIGGSNPTNRLSAFSITGIELNPGGTNVTVHWPTLPGRAYDIPGQPTQPGTSCCLALACRIRKPVTQIQPRRRAGFIGRKQEWSDFIKRRNYEDPNTHFTHDPSGTRCPRTNPNE